MSILRWGSAGLGTVLALTLSVGIAGAAETVTFRISVDTSPTHVRTVWVEEFAERLKARSDGVLDATVYHSGQLFKDVNVAKALRQGSVEMAVPGSWVLGGFERRLDAWNLPMLYGHGPDEYYAVSDGEPGRIIGAALEEKLDVKVLGKWFDLGASHTYFASRKVETYDDMKGAKVRFPGGAGLSARLEYLGATPVLVPWPDVPLAMSRGNFDGLITTNESVKSAKLWESGLKYVFEDYQIFGQYIPMVAGDFWKKLTPDQQQLMTALWDEVATEERVAALAAQQDAGEEAKRQGVVFVTPTPEQRTAVRQRMMERQDETAKAIGIPADFVEIVKAALPPD
ncbi:C4-dicarboxylate ABC transporter [Tistrella bauzanensis]|uniref:C4-dicarboxylate ABC transporter n=1 Tax=Tistrella bauzanensis TaxID=657419 RepID=A0ABQ1IGQ4_9PROT|nr:TRAP transporter substrate-binding protein DctP [Tistrella bauzanensis]GGB40597.1 C4-dicarboxylate ABC transporter [Tistrella bauzanensis]